MIDRKMYQWAQESVLYWYHPKSKKPHRADWWGVFAYHKEAVTLSILCGDCIEAMKNMLNNSIDMILTDPPYCSGGTTARDRQAATSDKYTAREYNGAHRFPDFAGDNMDQRAFTAFMRDALLRCREMTKPGGVAAVFIDWRNLPALTDALQMAGWIWRGVVVWDKGRAHNQPGRFRQDCEYIVWGSNGKMPVNWEPGQPALPGCYRIPGVPSRWKNHQTEKPVELLEKLLAICPIGGTVLDPFMGSGSMGVACANVGRKFIGIELIPEYYSTAERRISEAEMQAQKM